jgi:hypothetical protein
MKPLTAVAPGRSAAPALVPGAARLRAGEDRASGAWPRLARGRLGERLSGRPLHVLAPARGRARVDLAPEPGDEIGDERLELRVVAGEVVAGDAVPGDRLDVRAHEPGARGRERVPVALADDLEEPSGDRLARVRGVLGEEAVEA